MINKIFIIATCLLFLLIVLAVRTVAVEYADGYAYLNNSLALTKHSSIFTYIYYRPPLISIFNAVPLMFYQPEGAGITVLAPRIIALLLSAFSLAAVYKYLANSFGMLLLALSPLFIHYAPFVLTDIPGMLFLILGFYFYSRANRNFSAFFFALAFMCRYTHLIALFALFIYENLRLLKIDFYRIGIDWRQLLQRQIWRQLLSNYNSFLKVSLISLIIFFVSHTLIFLHLGRTWRSPFYVFLALRVQVAASNIEPLLDPFIEYPQEIWMTFTIPVCILLFIGIFQAIKQRSDFDLLNLSWLGIYFFFLMIATHREARYLFAVFPPILYFVVLSLQLLTPKLKLAVMLLILVLPIRLAVIEFQRFSDPLYTHSFMTEVAQSINQTNKLVCLEGEYFTFYPRNHNFLPDDEFMYYHHLNRTGLKFWLGKEIIENGGCVKIRFPELIWKKNAQEAPEPPPPFIVEGIGEFHYR